MNLVPIEYFQRMRLSNPGNLVISNPKRKRGRPPRTKIISERDTRILKSHCDLCNDELPKEADNIQYRINVLDEIDDSFESEYDKHEPRLLLCSFCTKECQVIARY